jgi:hypothetical protein
MSDQNINEALMAKKLVALLDENLNHLDTASVARLARARKAAVAAMARPRHAHVPALVVASWGRLAELSQHGGYRFWLPVLLLLAVVAGIISSSPAVRNHTPVSTDSLLLASELPPEVYADKEFVAWLEYTAQP